VQDSVTKLWNGGLSQTELDWITQVQAFSNVLTRNQIQYGIYAVRLDDVGNPWYASALECGLTINRNGLGCGVHANHVVAAVPILLSGPNASLPDDRFFDATTGPKELVFQCFINGAVDLDRTFVLARGRWAGLRLASKGTWDEKQQGYMWDNSLPAAPFQGGGTPQTCRIPLLIRLFRPSSPTVGIQVKFPDNAP